MPATDYHVQVRDAVATALGSLALGGVPVHRVDDLGAELSVPCVAVACAGPEQDRPEMDTNQSSGVGYPVAVALLTAGVADGALSPNTASLTLFRRLVTTAFHRKRLAGVPEVGWCEVSGDAAIFGGRDGPQFQKLSTELVVVAVGRFPRS